ncbi:MAG: peptidase, partial [Agathobaculum sp.]|nr:peptidase [Agathobaculum sp.]
MEPYYYQRLSKPMQEAYHAIKRGIESLSPAFPVPRLEMEQLSEVLFYLRLDCPEIFYITNFSCRVHPDALRVEFCPEYL